MKFETHTLENGMKVLLAPDKNAPSVTVMAMTGTGSRFETAQENGIAHFLEHMVFKGTKNRKNAKIIAEELDGVGGTFNAFTGKDHTAYYAKVDARHFETAFGVVSDIFLNPTLPKAEIEREKGTIIEEINMYEDMPMRNVLDKADQTIFGDDTPLGRSIVGPKKNIRAFTRKDFTDYFARNYVATNSALCIAGAFSTTKALKLAREAFKTMRTGDTPECEPYTSTQDAMRVHLATKQTDQTHFVLAVPGVALNHKDEVAVEVLAAVLGGGMSSRLFTQVRERRGLAYYVKADHDAYADTGALYVRAGVANDKVKDAITVSAAELQKMTKTLVPAAELAKSKEYIKGTVALSLETTDAQAAHMGYAALVRKSTKDLKAFYRAVDKVSAEDVRRVAKELLVPSKFNLTIIGPHTNEKAFAKLLAK